MNRNILIAVSVAIALLLVGGSFWVGKEAGKTEAKNQADAFLKERASGPGGGLPPLPGQVGIGGDPGGGGGPPPDLPPGFPVPGGPGGSGGVTGSTVGTVQKIEGNVLTLTTPQGETITVNMTDDTPVLKQTTASHGDLKAGNQIRVSGERSGNSMTAKGIEITDRPAGLESIFDGSLPTTASPTAVSYTHLTLPTT